MPANRTFDTILMRLWQFPRNGSGGLRRAFTGSALPLPPLIAMNEPASGRRSGKVAAANYLRQIWQLACLLPDAPCSFHPGKDGRGYG